MHNTKQKILDAAIPLFNEKGLVNVRLQHIADKAGISVGNLAYHYYSKKAIVEALYKELEQTINPILSPKQGFLHLIDFDNQLSAYYFLIKRYAFYFLDVLEMERAYPRLHDKRKLYISQMMEQIHQWMLQNVDKGILKPEIQSKQYELSAQTIWLVITFWITQQRVRETEEDEVAFKKLVWNQLLPLLTSQGLLEYNALILPQLT